MKRTGSGLIAILAIDVLGLVTLAADVPTATIKVDSPAFVFSPGNWTGDAGRGGQLFRQTWNPGAYFRVTWQTSNPKPAATLLFDTSDYPYAFKPPVIAYSIDGVWKSQIPCGSAINIENVNLPGKHELCVYLTGSEQRERWGSEGKSGLNVLRFTGLQVDAESIPLPITTGPKWALIVGDSITESVAITELTGYSYLAGEALRTQGYEYGISACGWSGWINKGDNPPGDVPGYYVITNSHNGDAGKYDDAASRWNKIDGNHHSLLDSQGHISAYGQTGQEPSLIMINYGTNDLLWKSNHDDTQAGMIQALAALRQSAPRAQIVVVIPFGQYFKDELTKAVGIHKQTHPTDTRVSIIDLGPAVATTLAQPNGFMGGLHPNERGHALFAARIIPQLMMVLTPALDQPSRQPLP